MKAGATERVFIGIDSGSTTTKIIASRPDGTIVFADYSMNQGNPIGAVEAGLKRLEETVADNNTTLEIAGSCSTVTVRNS